MPIVCGIKFRGAGKVYYFLPGEVQDLRVNDQVIVETARGVEMGRVVMAPREVDQSEIVGELKPILRRATPADLLDAQNFRQQEPEAAKKCRELAAKFNLPMKIVGAEYNYDGTRLTFFFTAEQRVDFRELVRELAHIFRTRIELRQIGVRDEAKILGGIGKCGRQLCCATWLAEFCPVSIRMAKHQDLPLSPMEISGLCGRLLCCLDYENDYYQEVKGRFPKVGKAIETALGPGKVVKVSVLKETVSILLEDGSTVELTADQLVGGSPIQPESRSSLLREEQVKSLKAVLPISEPPEAVKEAAKGEYEKTNSVRSERKVQGDEAAAAVQIGLAGDKQGIKSGSPVSRSSRKRRRARKASRLSPGQTQNAASAGQESKREKQENAAAKPAQGQAKARGRRSRRRRTSHKTNAAPNKSEQKS